ncbi:PAS domain-containing sensor histidine kinase [Telluribacter sp.]|jgi:signal transduction histidine kinase|uniref:PAS domain-containing sensor histidine kinase n=1 Tax=Telluribacter sp. TaxID=1978767 RepID=UPI002E119B3A|nr:ATP-binding protein [Telluribacter sp.]
MISNDLKTSSLEASVLYLVPNALIWVKPVFTSDATIEDFEIGYANKAAIEGVGHPKGNLKGLRILRDGVPSEKGAPENFKHFLEVYQTAEVKEFTFSTPYTNRVYETVRQPHNEGVLSITCDRGAQRQAELREKVTRRTMESIVKASPIGIAVFDAVRNSDDTILDFKVRVYNEQRNGLLGLTEEEGATLLFSEILEILGSANAFDRYVEVVEKGTFIQREQYVERSKKWLSISTVKLDDGFLAMLSDITELKQSQQVLQQQTDYLNSILNASLSAVFTCEAIRDEEGTILDLRYTQINEMYKQMIGKTEEEVLGKTMKELFPTAVPSGAFAIHCNVIETGVSARFDVRYQGEGLNAWFDTSSVKVGENGVVITFADVLEQKTAAQKIEEQKRLLDNILSGSSNGISVSKVIRNEEGKVVDGRTILANDAAVQIAGIPRDIYLSKKVTEIEPDMLQSPYFLMCVQTLETGEPFITQYFIELSGRWLEISVSRMDRDHLIHVFTDVTPIKEAQLQKDRLVEELRRSNQSLEEFAHAASHDMKEPLRKIRTFASRLKTKIAEGLDEKDTGLIDRIETAAERMQLLVDDLLEFSHVNERPREMDSVDLNEKVMKVLADLDLPVEEKGARVEVGPLPTVKGNERQLQQLFYNLIGNALKYSKPATPPEISIQSRKVMGSEVARSINLPVDQENWTYYLIEVRDNGIGFDQLYAERIFRMFNRLHGQAEYSGTGIGLSIAKKVTENHNGYIWATSEMNIGSTFHILLPV